MSEASRDDEKALRYPIGPFDAALTYSGPETDENINRIAALPSALRSAVSSLTESQLNTPYRAGAWTLCQVVHHLPDSHMNSFIRMKLALTEDEPTVRLYDEARWAELPDGTSSDIETSLALLESLHERWTWLLQALDSAAFDRPLVHPEMGRMTLGQLIAFYAWHGEHHLAHITGTARRAGWMANGRSNARGDEELELVLAESPSDTDIAVLSQGLDRHSETALGSIGFRPLAFFLRDRHDNVMGGVYGLVNWNWLHVKLLWLSESLQGRSHGSRLLDALESEARARGCKRCHLDTFSFQARQFYEGHGYELFGTLTDYPPGHMRFFLEKSLE